MASLPIPSRCRWLDPAGVADLLANLESYGLQMSLTRVTNPTNGTFRFYDVSVVPDFEVDGRQWERKPLQFHNVGNREMLVCSPSVSRGEGEGEGEGERGFERRCYWMKEESPEKKKIVAVHYRKIEKGSSLFVQEREHDSLSNALLSPPPKAKSSPSPLRRLPPSCVLLLSSLLAILLVHCCCRLGSDQNAFGIQVQPSGRDATFFEALTGKGFSKQKIRCSENGDVYQDVFLGPNARPMCECHPCYTGDDCSQLDENCALDLNSGSPRMFDCYWKSNRAVGQLVIPGDYRMGYENNGDESFYSLRSLEQLIRKLHDVVGNAVTEGKNIVIGSGSTQLYMAAIYALSDESDGQAMITAADPHYQLYDLVPPAMKSTLFSWGGNTSSSNVLNAKRTIELVTTPNNPDGLLRKPKLSGPNTFPIYDLAYHWPQFTPITRKIDEDVVLFTLSKLTGHAGSRIGWAIVRDPVIAKKMQLYLIFMSLGVAHESQLRASKLIVSLLAGIEREGANRKVPEKGFEDVLNFEKNELCISYASALMQGRWAALKKLFSETGKNSRLVLQPLEPAQKCNFFGAVREPSPAYLWLRCPWPTDISCMQLVAKHNLIGRDGTLFGVGSDYIRFSLLSHQSSFEILLEKLRNILYEQPYYATNVTSESISTSRIETPQNL